MNACVCGCVALSAAEGNEIFDETIVRNAKRRYFKRSVLRNQFLAREHLKKSGSIRR